MCVYAFPATFPVLLANFLTLFVLIDEPNPDLSYVCSSMPMISIKKPSCEGIFSGYLKPVWP